VTVESPVICRVDGCERRAAASVVGEDLPGPIQLCATHTEDFRMNGAAWTVTWTVGESGPISVQAAPATPVGRSSSGTASGTVSEAPGWAKLKTRLWGRRQSGS
jgi:hypothetical protein